MNETTPPAVQSRAVHICTLDYTEAFLEAERRLRRGDRQRYCGTCGLWVWPEACDHPGRLTERAFKALAARRARTW